MGARFKWMDVASANIAYARSRVVAPYRVMQAAWRL